MSGEQSKRLDALLESVTNSVNKMEVPVHVSPFLVRYQRFRYVTYSTEVPTTSTEENRENRGKNTLFWQISMFYFG